MAEKFESRLACVIAADGSIVRGYRIAKCVRVGVGDYTLSWQDRSVVIEGGPTEGFFYQTRQQIDGWLRGRVEVHTESVRSTRSRERGRIITFEGARCVPTTTRGTSRRAWARPLP